MRHFIFAAFLCALSMGCAFSSSARAEDTVLDTRTIAPLMRWVEAQTGVRVKVLPTVVVSMERFYRGIEQAGGLVRGRPQALYTNGMVVLNETTWDAADVRQVSVLVHELVHYAQAYTKRTDWECSNKKELQAYVLQNRWLAEHGERPFVSTEWINRVAQCDSHSPSISLAQTSGSE